MGAPESRQPPSENANRRITNYHSQCSDLPDPHRPIHYIGCPSLTKLPPNHQLHQHHHPLESGTTDLADNYPYVHLTTMKRDYLYPVIDEQHHHKPERLDRSNSGSSLKKPDILVSQVGISDVKIMSFALPIFSTFLIFAANEGKRRHVRQGCSRQREVALQTLPRAVHGATESKGRVRVRARSSKTWHRDCVLSILRSMYALSLHE